MVDSNLNGKIIAFRADASLDIGIGHVMRCLSLADELRTHGAVCYFVCTKLLGDIIGEIEVRGYPVHTIVPRSHNPIGNSQELVFERVDSEYMLEVLAIYPAVTVIVDHYRLARLWESTIRSSGSKVVVIDDLADRKHDCDLLVDQNLGRQSRHYEQLVPTYCKLLTGPTYAMLRAGFAEWRENSLVRRATGRLRHILISMGGVDRSNATGEVLNALLVCDLPQDLRITVVLGANSPWIAEVNKRAVTMPWRTEVAISPSNIPQLMADSDLAIGAAGGTAWERCYLGLPSLVAVLADNQRSGASALVEVKAALELGESTSFLLRLPDAIRAASSPEVLIEMSDSARLIVDGHGVGRVCEQIGALIGQH